MKTTTVLLLTGSAFSAAAGQILIKLGASGRQALWDFVNPQILGGLLLYGLATAIWIWVLASEKLVSVYAFTALTFVLVYLAGALILHETLQASAMAGVLLVLGGLWLIVRA